MIYKYTLKGLEIEKNYNFYSEESDSDQVHGCSFLLWTNFQEFISNNKESIIKILDYCLTQIIIKYFIGYLYINRKEDHHLQLLTEITLEILGLRCKNNGQYSNFIYYRLFRSLHTEWKWVRRTMSNQ